MDGRAGAGGVQGAETAVSPRGCSELCTPVSQPVWGWAATWERAGQQNCFSNKGEAVWEPPRGDVGATPEVKQGEARMLPGVGEQLWGV